MNSEQEHPGFTFSVAFEFMKRDKRLTRAGWNGKGLFIEVQRPDEHSKMSVPYLYISSGTVGAKMCPWVPTQTDLFATDWLMVS